ncbi:hypothetical protein MKX08_000572 [Trichoderma sp. CBMAI-0020]|nr:hypothetical protein MKX08_000572 [Trichoderma sp. CBMAI-0020]
MATIVQSLACWPCTNRFIRHSFVIASRLSFDEASEPISQRSLLSSSDNGTCETGQRADHVTSKKHGLDHGAIIVLASDPPRMGILYMMYYPWLRGSRDPCARVFMHQEQAKMDVRMLTWNKLDPENRGTERRFMVTTASPLVPQRHAPFMLGDRSQLALCPHKERVNLTTLAPPGLMVPGWLLPDKRPLTWQ